jgi:hypothetical protein
MLINPSDKNDLTVRFRKAPQGVVAKILDWLGVIALAVSVVALGVFGLSGTLETEGLSLQVCLTALNISIITFVAARLVELADRMLRISNRDRQ